MIDTMSIATDPTNDAPAELFCGKAFEWTATPESQPCQFELSASYFALANEDDNGS
jgi:hypothetical protein